MSDFTATWQTCCAVPQRGQCEQSLSSLGPNALALTERSGSCACIKAIRLLSIILSYRDFWAFSVLNPHYGQYTLVPRQQFSRGLKSLLAEQGAACLRGFCNCQPLSMLQSVRKKKNIKKIKCDAANVCYVLFSLSFSPGGQMCVLLFVPFCMGFVAKQPTAVFLW